MPAGLQSRQPVPRPHALLGPAVLTRLVSTHMDQQIPILFFLSKQSFTHRQFPPPAFLPPWPPEHHARRRLLPQLLPAVRGTWKEGPCSQLVSALTVYKSRVPAALQALFLQGQASQACRRTKAEFRAARCLSEAEDLALTHGTLPICTRRDQPLHGGDTTADTIRHKCTQTSPVEYTVHMRCTEKHSLLPILQGTARPPTSQKEN